MLCSDHGASDASFVLLFCYHKTFLFLFFTNLNLPFVIINPAPFFHFLNDQQLITNSGKGNGVKCYSILTKLLLLEMTKI